MDTNDYLPLTELDKKFHLMQTIGEIRGSALVLIMYERDKGIIIDDNPNSVIFDEILDAFILNGEQDYRNDSQPLMEFKGENLRRRYGKSE